MRISNSAFSLPTALGVGLLLALCAKAGAPAAQSTTAAAPAANHTAASSETTRSAAPVALDPSTQARLDRRPSRFEFTRDGRLTAPVRYPSDTRVLGELHELGYRQTDTFISTLEGLAMSAIVVRYGPLGHEANAADEAQQVFRAVVRVVDATGVPFVALRAQLGGSAERWDWLFWRSPRGWVRVPGLPEPWFRSKLDLARAAPQRDANLEAALLVVAAAIGIARGDSERALADLRDAYALVREPEAMAPVSAPTQLDVVHMLASRWLDELPEELGVELLARYAKLISVANIARPTAPIFDRLSFRHWQDVRAAVVTLEFDVLPSGRATNAVVIAATGGRAAVRAAHATLAGMRFVPFLEDGLVVVGRQQFVFRNRHNQVVRVLETACRNEYGRELC